MGIKDEILGDLVISYDHTARYYRMCREIEIMWYLEDHSARDCERETSTFIKRDEEKDSL